MNTTTLNDALTLIDKSKSILLLTHARCDADGLGAMISTYLVLKELGKDVTAATSDPTPENLAFLPAINLVQNSIASSADFIITLDCSRTSANKIKYNLENNRVNIIISPKNGRFTEKDVVFGQGSSEKYDLIIIFDTGNLEHLGALYDQNTEMFFKTPIINVDHHTGNTEYGQVNLVDILCSSATQVLYELLQAMEKKYGKKLVTEDIATLLLAGLITDTGSFQHANTSPQAMETAAQLLDLGARQQEIIKNIYKTKKLSTLKLWGIALSKVQVDPVYRMVWTTISQDDFREAGATSEETGSIIDDLLTNAPGAEVIFLIKPLDDRTVSISMRSTSNQIDIGRFCGQMGGGGHVRAAGFKVSDGRSFEQVVSDTVTKVREFQAERLRIHPEDLDQAKDAAKANEMKAPKKENGAKKEAVLLGTEKKGEETSSGVKKTETVKKETYLKFEAGPKPKPVAESAAATPAPMPAPVAPVAPTAPTAPTAPAVPVTPVPTVPQPVKTAPVSAPIAPAPKPVAPAVAPALPVTAPPAPTPATDEMEDYGFEDDTEEDDETDTAAETAAAKTSAPAAPRKRKRGKKKPVSSAPAPAKTMSAPAPAMPPTRPTPPVAPASPTPIAPAPKPVAPSPTTPTASVPATPPPAAPDVPDWLKAE